MKKTLAALLLSGLVAVTALTGCSNSSEVAEVTDVATTEAETSEDADVEDEDLEAKTEIAISHAYGDIVVPVNPSKVVVFDMGVLDTLGALAVDVEIAAPVKNIPDYLSQFADVANAGGIKEPDLEAIFEFEPEVIFIMGRQSAYFDELNEIAPTVYVELNAETYLDDFRANTRMIAEIFGKEAEAEEHLAVIDGIIEDANVITADSEERALILMANDGNISAFGTTSRYGFIHTALGVKPADENVEDSTHGQGGSFEYIADVNPDIIYIIDRGVIVGGSTDASTALDNELVNGTNAAINGKIVYLDAQMWYLAGGGLVSMTRMVEEAVAPLQ